MLKKNEVYLYSSLGYTHINMVAQHATECYQTPRTYYQLCGTDHKDIKSRNHELSKVAGWKVPDREIYFFNLDSLP